jgi:transcriptional repressor NrdR
MFCPFCNHRESRVLESRLTTENSVRRRRECEGCGKRFTTYEKLEVIQFLVVKRSGIREPYTREKLRAGLSRACAKTTVTAEQIDDLVDTVENELLASARREVSASMLGEIALTCLARVDQVAYVRFASVYRQFRSIEDFISELTRLKDESDSPRPLAKDDGGGKAVEPATISGVKT